MILDDNVFVYSDFFITDPTALLPVTFLASHSVYVLIATEHVATFIISFQETSTVKVSNNLQLIITFQKFHSANQPNEHLLSIIAVPEF
jgi:hypothetical protein